MGKDGIHCTVVNKFSVPICDNSKIDSSDSSPWHICRTTAATDSSFCQNTLLFQLSSSNKQSSADSAWKQASEQAMSIFSSETTILGGELWKMVRAASKRKTYVRVLARNALEQYWLYSTCQLTYLINSSSAANRLHHPTDAFTGTSRG